MWGHRAGEIKQGNCTMAIDGEDAKKPMTQIEIGEDLDQLSIDELESRIDVLQAEIERFRQSIEDKKKSKAPADMFFRN